jgi:2'-5' RNA ligase
VPRSGEPRLRLFVALDLPERTREELARWRDQALPGGDALRVLAPESLHVTLAFLGWQGEADVDPIRAAVGEAVAGLAAPGLAAGQVRAVPPRRPRLFALDLADSDGRCAHVQAAVALALEQGGFYEPEQRPFWPHVTLARVRRGRRAPALTAPPPAMEPFVARRVTLYRSLLRREGAAYEALCGWELG